MKICLSISMVAGVLSLEMLCELIVSHFVLSNTKKKCFQWLNRKYWVNNW